MQARTYAAVLTPRGTEYRNERGSSLIALMMISMVVALLTMVALASSTSALRASRSQRSAERALHLAEAGVSRALGLLSGSPDYANAGSLGSSPSREDVVAAVLTADLETAPGGEFSWLVPAGDGVAYGVGFVPSRDQAESIRVARVEYEKVRSATGYALLAEGSVSVAGSATITGSAPNVHANRDLSIGGGAVVDGDATAGGSATVSGSAAVGGDVRSGAAQVPASIDLGAYRSLVTHDLCPDVTVRLSAAVACTGSVVGSGLLGWNGWTYHSLTGWTMAGQSTVDGGFYVHGANATISGSPGSDASPWRVTIIVAGLEVGGILSSGDLRISGNPVMRPRADGVLAVAARDLAVSGSSPKLEGLLMAGEHVSLTGNGTVLGQVIAAGASDTLGSLVPSNVLDDMTLIADPGGPASIGGVTVTRWSEL